MELLIFQPEERGKGFINARNIAKTDEIGIPSLRSVATPKGVRAVAVVTRFGSEFPTLTRRSHSQD